MNNNNNDDDSALVIFLIYACLLFYNYAKMLVDILLDKIMHITIGSVFVKMLIL